MLERAYQALKRLIDRFEGLSLRPYRCPAGIWTIGRGHTKGITASSPPITLSLAEQFEREDAAEAMHWALKLSPNLARFPNALAAVADFIFNLGVGRYKASTLRRKIRDEEWRDAADEIMKWVWGGGRKLPGLVARRYADALLFSPP